MNKKKDPKGFNWSWVKENFWHVLIIVVIWEIFKLIVAGLIILGTR